LWCRETALAPVPRRGHGYRRVRRSSLIIETRRDQMEIDACGT
jgi:hypothetical protein